MNDETELKIDGKKRTICSAQYKKESNRLGSRFARWMYRYPAA
jgi:hypothetical protein